MHGPEVAVKYGYRRYLLLKNWRSIVQRLLRTVCRALGDAEVYVFGSVVEGRFTVASDIDVLIVSSRVEESEKFAVELQLLIEDELKLPPGLVHLHVAKPGGERLSWFRDVLKARLVPVGRCRASATRKEG